MRRTHYVTPLKICGLFEGVLFSGSESIDDPGTRCETTSRHYKKPTGWKPDSTVPAHFSVSPAECSPILTRPISGSIATRCRMGAVCPWSTNYDRFRRCPHLGRSGLAPGRWDSPSASIGSGLHGRCDWVAYWNQRRVGRAIGPAARLLRNGPFEKGGRVYDYLGVRWYQQWRRPVRWSVNPTLFRSQPGARQTRIRATHDPEAGHLITFVVIFGITLWALTCGWWDSEGWLLLFNVLHNQYLVLSVRPVRARLRRHGRTA